MGDIAIKIENLTKEYRLGTIGHGTLREDMQSAWARFRGKEDPNSLVTTVHNANSEKKHFLALDDISCEIKKGDRVGIIGKNGAGKSTLLKILSRITSPTRGNIYIDGRIGSLLEVGTGFHGELTGRENVYLNGAIMGMSKVEINKKFDEIVDFSGVEKFIDTPVKRYSSGMFVRLGFAVAAHLEPEILIVDEVLAVGDVEFQQKAIGKMNDVSKGDGRTILFVSHNMGSIRKLCNKGMLLERGKLTLSGDIEPIVDEYYHRFTSNNSKRTLWENVEGKGDNSFLIKKIWITKADDSIVDNFIYQNESFFVDIVFYITEIYKELDISIRVFNEIDQEIFMSATHDFQDTYPKFHLGENHLRCYIPEYLLNEGSYQIYICAFLNNIRHIIKIEDSISVFLDIKINNQNDLWFKRRPGVIAPLLKWISDK